MKQFYQSCDPKTDLEYKNLLGIWQGTRKLAYSFKSKCIPNQKLLKEGIYKLPYRLQNQLFSEAKKVVGSTKPEKNQTELLLEYFDRKLQKEFIFNNFPEFYKNRLKAEGFLCDYIKWNDCQNNEAFLNTMLYDIKVDYKTKWRRSINSFLMLGGDENEIQSICKYGINQTVFNQNDDYSEVPIKTFFDELPLIYQSRLLYILGLISADSLDLNLDILDQEYYNMLVNSKVEYATIFKYFIKYKKLSQPNIYYQIFKKVDAINLIKKESIEIQKTMLSIMVHLKEYHHKILEFKGHHTKKLREHARFLIDKYQLKVNNERYKIVDFGLYKMLGVTTPEERFESKTTIEPILIKETEKVEVPLKSYVGLRFTSNDYDKSSTILNHTVKISHPIKLESGRLEEGLTEWKQNGFSHSNIFLGWHFDSLEELIEGEYTIRAFDEKDELIVEKSFDVSIKKN
ncbi:hypothetical protein KMW28_27530 [Flammeovirga yaeyamensis]|uniref:DUF3859 domain-containing protein n=1 Tax=Flammeovirga yaeyamensis TaxID=367791 RepID=A0AAX1NAZ3_9BACT|nr:hypothetical protein [Flammeovirga yaeyamensis]MBB3699964.1 hypothetical protein [Flammeovirga yaeyamensis]NMF37597.1 hypothetical protein [Flammeovirga yaeyamensis]QWG04654.1 hypothetical protein KMW28_27530 [Flammeovirga yaeyamensis]